MDADPERPVGLGLRFRSRAGLQAGAEVTHHEDFPEPSSVDSIAPAVALVVQMQAQLIENPVPISQRVKYSNATLRAALAGPWAA